MKIDEYNAVTKNEFRKVTRRYELSVILSFVGAIFLSIVGVALFSDLVGFSTQITYGFALLMGVVGVVWFYLFIAADSYEAAQRVHSHAMTLKD